MPWKRIRKLDIVGVLAWWHTVWYGSVIKRQARLRDTPLTYTASSLSHVYDVFLSERSEKSDLTGEGT
jgi:hypothetical protein